MNPSPHPGLRACATIEPPDGRHLTDAEYGDPAGGPAVFCHGRPGIRVTARLADEPATSRPSRRSSPSVSAFHDAIGPSSSRVSSSPSPPESAFVGSVTVGINLRRVRSLAGVRLRGVRALVGFGPVVDTVPVGASQIRVRGTGFLRGFYPSASRSSPRTPAAVASRSTTKLTTETCFRFVCVESGSASGNR